MPDPQPWTMEIDESVLIDLRRRIEATRFPDHLGAADSWDLGTAPDFVESLASYWADGFDWRVHEDRINRRLPGFTTTVGPHRLHFARVRSQATGTRLPLVLLHGWPSSFVEFERLAHSLLERRPDLDIVIPSLPGHGFSAVPDTVGLGADACADVIDSLMTEHLGYDRYVVHGGDRGAFVATSIAERCPESTTGIHLTLPTGLPAATPDRPADEQAWLDETAAWSADEGGYAAIQGTRPQTLAYAMHDSPVGQLAWIVEKFHTWSDGGTEQCFSADELLVNATIYWVTGTFRSAAHWYWEHRVDPPAAMRPVRIEVPTGVARFPREVMRPPRSAVARKYDLVHWTEMPAGGHFPALEQTELLADDLVTFLDTL